MQTQYANEKFKISIVSGVELGRPGVIMVNELSEYLHLLFVAQKSS